MGSERSQKKPLISVVLLAGMLFFFGCGEKKPKEHEARERRPAAKVKGVSRRKKGTQLGGPIVADRVLKLSKSPYILTQNLEVRPEVKLSIEPGVVIKAEDFTAIVVNGNFHVMGTPDKPIRFTSAKKNGKWDGIIFRDESFDYESDELIKGHGCIVEYAIVENARSGILCEKSTPLLRSNVIQNNEEGIKCRSNSNPLIKNNLFKDNMAGIVCENDSSPEITSNTIIGGEGKGISCMRNSSPVITNNIIFGAGETWWAGILCGDSSAPKVNHNNIYSNGGHNIKLIKFKVGELSLDISAEGNWWGTDNKEAITNSIFDQRDKGELGEVKFTPYVKTKLTDVGYKK